MQVIEEEKNSPEIISIPRGARIQFIDEEIPRDSRIFMLSMDTLVDLETEACYLAARGGPMRFSRYGTNQMYWKGRSDAANAVRMRRFAREKKSK